MNKKQANALPPIYHIGAVVRDMDSTIQFLSTVFGLTPRQRFDFHLKKEEFIVGAACSFRLAGAKLGPTLLELIQPVSGRSFWPQSIETKGDGINQLTFSVSKWQETAKRI